MASSDCRRSSVATWSSSAYFATRSWSHFASSALAAPANKNAAAAAATIPLFMPVPSSMAAQAITGRAAAARLFALGAGSRCGRGCELEGAALLLASAFHLGPGLHFLGALAQRREQLLPPGRLRGVGGAGEPHHGALHVHP